MRLTGSTSPRLEYGLSLSYEAHCDTGLSGSPSSTPQAPPTSLSPQAPPLSVSPQVPFSPEVPSPSCALLLCTLSTSGVRSG